MRDKVFYEWCEEIRDKNGDCIDMNHFEPGSLYERMVWIDGGGDQHVADLDDNEELVLVFNTGNESEGITDRSWAYVNLATGKLPEKFENGRKVPKRFHEELARWVSLKTLPLNGYTKTKWSWQEQSEPDAIMPVSVTLNKFNP
ncbi:MAG: hypothetical protein CMC15_13985 [Flavobacteriaceae bacterium]|nr:hypothetical protein [Flavobacteriaceae bacterium]|tara:strand:- start:7630 stop:8061 length:432 start_codon:yes stop_codon:yes gene_type:complete